MKIKEFEQRLCEVYYALTEEESVEFMCGCRAARKYIEEKLQMGLVTETGHIRQRHIKRELQEQNVRIEKVNEEVIDTVYIRAYKYYMDVVIENCLSGTSVRT